MTNSKILINLVVALSFLFSVIAQAAKPIYSGGKERAAIRGYDPVAYFVERRPVKGLAEFSFEYEGAKWMFSSQQNLDSFKNNPKKYTPQYGGYCAYAVARGTTASIKPEFFTIQDDKLYLNYSKSVYKRWTKGKDDYIQSANKNWPKVLE